MNGNKYLSVRPFTRQFFGALTIFGLFACTDPGYTQIQGQTMGTYFQIQYAASDTCQLDPQIATTLLAEINGQMSTYQADSELSLINAKQNTTWTDISPGLAEVMGAAEEVWRASQGAFDVTVGPLVNVWGFGPERAENPPTIEQQVQAARRVGMDKVELDDDRLRKTHGDVYIDLSALAKGYAVDQLAELLVARHCEHFMVDIGGEMRLAGNNPKGQPWRIGIEVPDPQRIGMLQEVLTLADVAIATSGDYRNYREVDGVRVDHVIDPRSGKPAATSVVSATVLHAEAMWADAFATTLMVLNPEEGIAFAQAQNLAVYIIYKQAPQEGVAEPEMGSEDRFKARYTAPMQEYLPQVSS